MTMQSAAVTDFSHYQRLRAGARDGDAAAVEQTAQRFEGLFIEMMLKSMRETLPGEDLFGSDAGDLYWQLFDSQISESIAAGGGLGIADMLERQLDGGARAEPATSIPARASASAAAPVQMTEQEDGGNPPSSWESPAEFIQAVLPDAQAAAQELGLPVEAVLAQLSLETGWGRHIPQADGRTSNNLFGIKADSSWDGFSVTVATIEVRDGIAVHEQAAFRAYDSIAESIRDWTAFLRDNPRYHAVVEQSHDVSSFANALQQGGYATDPQYADKIRRVASSDTLQQALARGRLPMESGT